MDDFTHLEHKPQPGDFMRLLMQHEPALRAYSRSMLPD